MRARLERKGDDLVLAVSEDDVRELGLVVGQDVEIHPVRVASASEPARRFVNGFPIYTMAEMAAEMRRLGPDFEPPTVDWGPDVGSEIIDDDDSR
ncbi:MazF family transcriptional regulator [Methylobacterium sp. J-059]|uniref:MazF family transcriptional regulator n=1 Tax=Methylobacterium sp. J-059 TaxID=2836643 RepID=UPI001FBB95E3|nr:MazF family transcriptional regulator [Methylobacterium sp. J-059]MCJ2039694.1 MazF family transcriptional regulator [Methylobacterium sp. J-059]